MAGGLREHRDFRILSAMVERYPLDVHYDFASTICFVAHRVLGRLAGRIDEIGVDLRWRPLDLTQITGWRRGARVAGPGRENALRVARELQVPVQMPGSWIDSRAASALALALVDRPAKEAVWRERVWSGVYEEGRDIGDPQELRAVAAEVGLEDLPGGSGTALEEETQRAREAGLGAVPSFMVDQWAMGGIQDDESMVKFFERFVRKRRRERAVS